jgi:hypothetical protein
VTTILTWDESTAKASRLLSEAGWTFSGRLFSSHMSRCLQPYNLGVEAGVQRDATSRTQRYPSTSTLTGHVMNRYDESRTLSSIGLARFRLVVAASAGGEASPTTVIPAPAQIEGQGKPALQLSLLLSTHRLKAPHLAIMMIEEALPLNGERHGGRGTARPAAQDFC